MKQFSYLTIVLLFLIVNSVTSQMSREEAAKFLTDVQDCKNDTGSTEQDVDEFFSRALPTTKPGKCLNACVLGKIDVIKDGKLAPGGLLKVVEMDKSGLTGKDGKTLTDSMKDISGECMAVADPDKCEFAAKLRACLNAAAKKRLKLVYFYAVIVE